MTQRIVAPVSVEVLYDHRQKPVFPKRIFWHGRSFQILKLGLHHTFYKGRTLLHVFSVASSHLAFRLTFNTETLSWILDEISDGYAD